MLSCDMCNHIKKILVFEGQEVLHNKCQTYVFLMKQQIFMLLRPFGFAVLLNFIINDLELV